MSSLDELITLGQASERFFAGRVKAPGLRRERDRGNLTTIFVAGKEFTTPRHIQEMVKRCEKMPRDRASGSGQSAETPPVASRTAPSGSSATAPSNDRQAMDLALERLRSGNSPRTSRRSSHNQDLATPAA